MQEGSVAFADIAASIVTYNSAMTRVQANLLLLSAGAIWGMGFVAQSTAMDSVEPFTFIACRFSLATLLLLPFAWIESRKVTKQAYKGLTKKEIFWFCIIGVSLFLGMATQQVGLLTTTVTNSGFLTGLYVVFTPFVAVLLYRQWPHWVVWPATLIAFFGLFFLSGGGFEKLVVGDALTIASACFWALQVVLIGRYVGVSNRPFALSALQFFVTAILAWVLALGMETWEWPAVQMAWKEIVYTGVFAGGLAFTLQVIGQRYTTAPQAAIFLSSEAPFAAAFGMLLLGERIGIIGLLGCAFILSAMLLVELGPGILSGRNKVQVQHTK